MVAQRCSYAHKELAHKYEGIQIALVFLYMYLCLYSDLVFKLFQHPSLKWMLCLQPLNGSLQHCFWAHRNLSTFSISLNTVDSFLFFCLHLPLSPLISSSNLSLYLPLHVFRHLTLAFLCCFSSPQSRDHLRKSFLRVCPPFRV